ncbi:hypothetical protein DFP73DRAFT_602057 [Morchella snyderi]|nr:hypothetical protein DFP73DRAFT_602057 [Morchella snyderi]
MPLNKRSAGSVLLSAKRPRLPVPPEEHDDSQTDGSEISFRALTALSTGTRSSQSTSTRSSQSTTAPIARKGLLRSTDTSTGRSSPRREEQPEEHVPEVEETADTSHSEYDDSPENDQESSEENPDVPEDQHQASTQQRSQSTGKRPRTVQPTTARALGNARRRPTGAVAQVICFLRRGQNANYSEGNTTGCEGNTERRSRESSTHFGTQTKCIPENAHRIPESVDFSAQPGSISESIPGISESFPGVSESTPDTLTVHAFFSACYSRDIDYSSSTRHINLSSMRSRYGDSSPTYHPYRSSPPFEGVEAQPRVYDIAQLSSSIREEENAPKAESEVSSIPESTDDRFESIVNIPATQRIEKECSTLIGDHTLLHEPFPPAPRLSVLVANMWAAASRRVGCAVDLDEVVIKQVRSLHSRVRSHLMHEVKGRLADSTIYGLGKLSSPEARAASNLPSTVSAPEIIDILYYKYFDGVRMRGHGIRAWSTGTYVKPDHFQSQNESVGRSRQNQEATLEVIKDNLREKEKKGITIEVIPEDGFSEDDEALAADLAAFRNARKALPSAREDISGSDNGGGQDEVVHAQLRGIEAEEEGEENEEEQEEGDHEGGEERKDV